MSPLLDALGQLDLFRGGEQRVAAGLVQEHLERIGCVEAGADRQVELELVLVLRVGSDVVHGELVSERFRLGLVEIVGEDGVRNIGRGDRPVLGTEGEQRFERSATAAVMLISVNELLLFFEDKRARGLRVIRQPIQRRERAIHSLCRTGQPRT